MSTAEHAANGMNKDSFELKLANSTKPQTCRKSGEGVFELF